MSRPAKRLAVDEWMLALLVVAVCAAAVVTVAIRLPGSTHPVSASQATPHATPSARASASIHRRLRPVTASEFAAARAALPKLTLAPHDLPAPAVADKWRPGGIPGTDYFVGCIAAHAGLDQPPLADREFTTDGGYFDGVVALAPSESRAGRLEAVLRTYAAGTCALQTLVTFAPSHYRYGTPRITVATAPRLLDRSSTVMFRAPVTGPSVKNTIYMEVVSAQSGPFIALGTFVSVDSPNDPSLETTSMRIMASRILRYRNA